MHINRVDISSYIPDIISPMDMLMTIGSVELHKRCMHCIESNNLLKMLCTKSNNWLKMHGYPMRRRKSLK
jgi:hypothetical protein|nr:MAG TPA: hypothetical protein [Caudoviricetes sp.]